MQKQNFTNKLLPKNHHLGFAFDPPPLITSIGVSLFYLFVFLLYSYPLISDFTGSFISPAQNGDPAVFVWNAYNFTESIHNGENPFYTNRQIFPVGGSMIMHSHTTFISLFNLVFDNPILSANVALLLSFVFSGLGGFLLSYKFNQSLSGSVLVGFIFSFAPFKTAHLLEHYNLMLTAVIPFFALAYNKAFTFTPQKFLPINYSTKWILVCILIGGLGLLSDYYITFFMLYYAGLVWLYNAFLCNKTFVISKKTISQFILSIMFFHFVVQLAKLYLDDKAAFWLGGDIAAFFTPSYNSYLFGNEWLRNFKDSFQPYQGSLEYEMFLGWTLLLSAIVLLLKFFKKQFTHSLTGFLTVLFFLMCLPAIKVFGISLLNTPTSVLHFIPFFNHVHVPPRIVLMLGLFLPILIVKYLLVFPKQNRIILSIFLLLFVEYYPKPFPTMSQKDVPEWVHTVKNSDYEKVIPVPTGLRDGLKGYGNFNSNHLFYQTIHKKPIIGGYLSRLPESTFLYYRDILGLDSSGIFKNKNSPILQNAFWAEEE